tara:strand:+ start:388 stop:819 length:432 start_codon:yes stop_codon:yes gene_type:complete
MKKDHRIKKSWIWPKKVHELVESHINGRSVNICAGQSTLGTVKVDLDKKNKPDVIANMRNLPFDDDSFDTVISDPPWKLGYYQRWKPFFECVRVCKIGGKIIYNSTWMPDSDQVKLIDCWIRSDTPFGNASFIGVYRKVSNGT